MAQFRIVSKEDVRTQENDIISLWQKSRAFERSIEQRSDEERYVFYDGPPFATGLPHYGHLVASTLKDVIPRYWAMRGKKVERRFGWDTHGLPIEMEIEKKLNLSGPTSVREYGVAKFNEACRENVLTYTEEWRKTITRLGRWVDFDNDYKTMDLSFMESVWWVFEELWKKDLVYQGHRVMPYSWRLSTPLSNFEANSDYRDVDDPAITVSMPILGDEQNAKLLVWTTTPWTLPSNLGVAVGKDIDYVRAEKDGEVFICAAALKNKVLGEEANVLQTFKGDALEGAKYEPLFDYFIEQKDKAFFVMLSDHVTTESGTGLVHMAPAYGEDDFNACAKVGIGPVDPVDDEGNFTEVISDFQGQNVKEADKGIIKALKEKGRLFRQDVIRHSYPFCWRSGTPLIYKTVPVWFVKVTEIRDRMVENNKTIHWVPNSVGNKRFGNWLNDARDWAISRNRFWGTPIPLWQCENKHTKCLGSAQALQEQSGEAVTDIHPHKIDHLEIDCDECDQKMKRIPEVFDCWFESGSMPYAQEHYPFEGKEKFEKGFPAQFIAEGLDQTRGWFYTLLILGTALFDDAPFKNCIVNGLVLATSYTDQSGKRYQPDEVDVKGGKAFRKSDGKELVVKSEKMSKRLKNYPDPMVVLDEYGADALRAYLINSPVVRAEPLKFSESGVREVVRTVLIPLKNAWSFFVQYANIDGFDPTSDAPPLEERSELDRWILSVLQSNIDNVNREMEGYYLYKVVTPLLAFIDDLTNWYIRRSRRRFWRNAETEAEQKDKNAAYHTLYEVLVTFSKVIAPVLPFISESIYQNLVCEPKGLSEQSVHLCDYPMAEDALIDKGLESAMSRARSVVKMGRALRERHKLKTRQPLRSITIVSSQEGVRKELERFAGVIAEELNVKEVVVTKDDSSLAKRSYKADFKRLGRRYGKNMKAAATAIAQMSDDDYALLESGKELEIEGQMITHEDVGLERSAKEGVVLESEGDLTIALDSTLDDELIAEGRMRDLVSALQNLRKESGLEVTDRISLRFHAEDALKNALAPFVEHIKTEVLATEVVWSDQKEANAFDLSGAQVHVSLNKN